MTGLLATPLLLTTTACFEQDVRRITSDPHFMEWVEEMAPDRLDEVQEALEDRDG